MKRNLSFAAAIAFVALLAACAAPTVKSDVTVFQDWPSDMQGAVYVFERTKEQNDDLEYRTYENLVRGEMQRLGFAEASPAQNPKLKVTISYGIAGRDVQVVEPVVVDPDPFWPGPFYGPRFYGPRYYGYYRGYSRPFYSPFYDPFWYGPPLVEYEESTYQVYDRRLKVSIWRMKGSKKLYDVTVDSQGKNPSLPDVMPYLVRSAFTGFPGKNGESRHIELPMSK
jgi:hypothetical protein